MVNTTERAYQLVEATGCSMFAFCKAHRLPYTTINNHYIHRTKITLSTVELLCEALGITEEEFFREKPGG